MARLIIYLLLLSSIMLVLSFVGVIPNSTFGVVLSLIKDPNEIHNSSFYVTILAIVVSLVGAAAVVIGSLVGGRTDLAIKAPLIAILLPMLFDIVGLWNKIASYGGTSSPQYALASLLVAPLAIIWVITVLEWWGGHD